MMIRRFCHLLLLSIAMQSGVLAQESSWPTTRFEIYVGSPTPLYGKSFLGVTTADFGTTFDTESLPDVALSPELRREIEAYLYTVANHYQSLGFPAPIISSIVTDDNGQKRYRIYYYDFDEIDTTAEERDKNPSKVSKPDTLPARYSTGCGEDNFYVLLINAKLLTKSGKITAKGYGDLAHELFHGVQRATKVGIDNCHDAVGTWLYEGAAEAIGHDMAQRFRNVSLSNPVRRWGLRPYHNELYQGPRDGKKAYQSSSFWRYIAERYQLKLDGYTGDLALPGPEKPSPDQINYGYHRKLWSTAISGSGEKAELEWLNSWLLSEFNADLQHVFLQFVAVMADYASYRVEQYGWSDNRWRQGLFGGSYTTRIPGCSEFELDPANGKRDVTFVLPLYRVGAMCVELKVGATKGPLDWNVQTTTDSEVLLKQLALGLGGGQQFGTSAVFHKINDSAFVADWIFELEPNKTHHLLISNTATKPSSTKRQDVEVRISLATRTPPPASAPPKSARKSTPAGQPKPGPAGAKAARQLRQQEKQGGPNGSGSIFFENKAGGKCSPQSSWRFGCEGGAVLRLGMNIDPGAMFDQKPGGTGGLFGQMMSVVNIDMQEMGDIARYLDETAGTEIVLRIPGVDYGFTGTVTDAEIMVSGTPEQKSRVSWPTRATTAESPCAYRPPNGTVIIHEFSKTMISGSYRGQLVEAGSTRPGRKVKCPLKRVVGSIEGEFTLPAPWKSDSRAEVKTDWLREDMGNEIQQMLPPGLDYDVDTPMKDSAPSSSSGGGSNDPFDSLDNLTKDDCTCTSAGMAKAQQAMQRIMLGGPLNQNLEDLRLTMCLQLCLVE